MAAIAPNPKRTAAGETRGDVHCVPCVAPEVMECIRVEKVGMKLGAARIIRPIPTMINETPRR